LGSVTVGWSEPCAASVDQGIRDGPQAFSHGHDRRYPARACIVDACERGCGRQRNTRTLFFQGEYFWYNVARGNLPGLPSLQFDGGYAQASLVLTGESHRYIPAYAAYGGISPANPFSLRGGGWGAWEIAGRVSTINLNDQLGTASGVAGGRQTIYNAGLNWYVNSNIRFMFDYLHGNIAKQVSPTNSGDAGARFDAFAMRTQVAF
jgi:phosphate-selective porin OprO and OprP